MENNWYVATVIIGTYINHNHGKRWTCDEQIRLIQAPNRDKAYEKALIIGKNEEHSYENEAGETISWIFLGLNELEEVVDETISDGCEIRSRLFHHINPRSLINSKDNLSIYL